MKKIFLVVIGSIIIGLLIGFNNYTRSYFDNNDKIVKNLNLLKQKELKLNYEIFTISVYLYKNFDSIVMLEKEIDKILDELTNNKEFKSKQKSYNDFLRYKKDIKEKIDKIYEIETIIAPIKNATMYIAELTNQLPISKLEPQTIKIYLNIASNIFLAKSSLDKTFIKNINIQLNMLKKLKENKFNQIFIRNVELINELFPLYVKKMENILHSKSNYELQKCFSDFLIETNDKLRVITMISVLLILFVLFSILLILFLFISLEKENKILEKITITDELTGLYNRRKLQRDIKNNKNKVLFILNIDRFKYFNDFYGIETGDYILKEVALILNKIFPKQKNLAFYRLGADEFGVLFDKTSDKKLLQIASNIEYYFKHNPIIYKDLEFHILFSIGISYISPLMETADIILKIVKKDKEKSYAIYSKESKEKNIIEQNIKKSLVLKDAIKNKKIIPYYQPIYSNKTGKIVKYEVLARVVTDDGVMSIYPFLNIAKENREYKYITQMIYTQAFEKFKDKQIEFSLNLSIEDINSEETMNFIYTLMEKYEDVFKYVTFEILEDDAINNYNELKEFIVLVKKLGSKVAIDDFGSGYSNFAHVLNLEIDYLKIDGSLVKNLETDEKMYLIVETIVEFAKKTNVETIAEFVHNEAVLNKVKKLDIDYSQGFYLGEPKGDI